MFNPKLNLKVLLEAKVHFGHRVNFWNPLMERYICGTSYNVHIINVFETAKSIYTILQILYLASIKNSKILFIGTKHEYIHIIKNTAKKCGQYYINHRWLGGMLTNWVTIYRSVSKLKDYIRIIKRGRLKYTKKELLIINQRKVKLQFFLGGVKDLNDIPDILFIVNTKSNIISIKEAKRLGIITIGIADSDSYLKGLDFIIPGNDDSIKSIILYCTFISETIIFAKKYLYKK